MIEIRHGNRLCICTEPGGLWIEVGRVEMIVTREDAETVEMHVVWSVSVYELMVVLGTAYARWYPN